ncbi:MAG TPA: amidohydrolase family protein, partial [Burkholderiales bacterium]|nr:amidohydrolase family protein [Burkholderiales bacterium]
IKKAPSTYLKKFFFDTITFDTQMLRHLVDKYGSEHIVLGTDYPFDMGMDDPVKFIESVPRLTRADKDKIMGGNAARLLKIKR